MLSICTIAISVLGQAHHQRHKEKGSGLSMLLLALIMNDKDWTSSWVGKSVLLI